MDVSKLIEPIMRPNKIKNTHKIETVVLDPGHGGMDQGASSSWGTEKGFALDVALAARKELIRAGYRVEMTRVNDVGVSLEERVSFANRFPHAVFVSIILIRPRVAPAWKVTRSRRRVCPRMLQANTMSRAPSRVGTPAMHSMARTSL